MNHALCWSFPPDRCCISSHVVSPTPVPLVDPAGGAGAGTWASHSRSWGSRAPATRQQHPWRPLPGSLRPEEWRFPWLGGEFAPPERPNVQPSTPPSLKTHHRQRHRTMTPNFRYKIKVLLTVYNITQHNTTQNNTIHLYSVEYLQSNPVASCSILLPLPQTWLQLAVPEDQR